MRASPQLDNSEASPPSGRARRARRATDALLVAAFAALSAAAVQTAMFLGRYHLLHEIGWQDGRIAMSRDLVWMAPLSFLLIFAVPAALLALLALLLPRAVPIPVPVAVFAFVALFGVLLLVPEIHQYASMVLALGVAVHLARLAARHESRARTLARRGAAALAIVFLLLGGGTRLARAVGERNAMASLPDPPPGAPNVLLLILDTVRASAMSLHGYHRPTTPHLDSLARESVVFDRAFATAPWTLPTHATLFTGAYPAELSTGWREPLDERQRTLAEALAARGYATGGFVANFYYTMYETGLGRGFAHYEDTRLTLGQIFWSSSLAQTDFLRRIAQVRRPWAVRESLRRFDFRLSGGEPGHDPTTAAEVNDAFLAWQQGVEDRPFFAFLNYFDAHGPFRPPDGFQTRFAAEPTNRDRYDGGIAYIDREIGRLLRTLKDRGALENTVVVITSDHGELFQEFAKSGHGNALYPQLLQVPLLIHYPRVVPGGIRVGETVSLRDLPRTITALAGLTMSPEFPGAPLTSIWEQDAPARVSRALAELQGGPDPDNPNNARPMHAVIEGDWQYIREVNGLERLYDLRTVYSDTTNLIARPEHAALLHRLRALDSTHAVRRAPLPSLGRNAPGG